MSQESVEIVKAAIDAYNRGDLDAALKDAAPDSEIDMTRAVGIVRGVYSPNQMRRIWQEWAKAWESDQFGADEFIDAGEHVVTPFTNHLRGRDGIEVTARGVWVWTIRDGAIVRVCLYQDRAEALEAAGLRE
jgi:ketosteroid isomerase-like protein